MESPSPGLTGLAASIRFPDPDEPDNPESSFTLPAKEVRKLAVLLSLLMDYIRIELERCGKAAQ